MSFRATYYVTIMLDAPLNASNFEEALAAAKKKEWKQLIKLQSGVEACDWKVDLYGVNDMNQSGGM